MIHSQKVFAKIYRVFVGVLAVYECDIIMANTFAVPTTYKFALMNNGAHKLVTAWTDEQCVLIELGGSVHFK